MRMRVLLAWSWIIICQFLCCSPAFSAQRPYAATVLRVLDGDTIEVQHGQAVEHIRLFGIDCPEKNQEFGPEATKATTELAAGKRVSIEPASRDRDNRVVAVVILPDKINLNQKLVAMGMAWWWKEYAPKSTQLPKNQSEAKAAKLGLWAKTDPIPPWEFRAQRRGKDISEEPAVQPKKQAIVDQVYIAETGNCYHRRDCRTIKNSKVTLISRAEAKKKGYKACKVCKP
ncbi:thermonuclease family protein [bacterium]|nr:thermonuclease family protein [bacterium]